MLELAEGQTGGVCTHTQPLAARRAPLFTAAVTDAVFNPLFC